MPWTCWNAICCRPCLSSGIRTPASMIFSARRFSEAGWRPSQPAGRRRAPRRRRGRRSSVSSCRVPYPPEGGDFGGVWRNTGPGQSPWRHRPPGRLRIPNDHLIGIGDEKPVFDHAGDRIERRRKGPCASGIAPHARSRIRWPPSVCRRLFPLIRQELAGSIERCG